MQLSSRGVNLGIVFAFGIDFEKYDRLWIFGILGLFLEQISEMDILFIIGS